CQRANRITDNFEHFLRHWQQLPLFESPGPVDLKLREKYAAIQQSQSPEAIAASLRGFGTGRMQPCCGELSRLQLPVLLIAGSADRKDQQINQAPDQTLPNAHFSSIQARHRAHLDNPPGFIKEIKLFMYGRD